MSPRPIWIVAAATLVATAHADETAVRATLQRSFPQSPIQSISKSPVPGLVEAVIGGQILYLTEDGRYPSRASVRLRSALTSNSGPPRAGQGQRSTQDCEVMRTGAVPAGTPRCANPMANIAEFAKRHRISSTPTTILADGRRLVGAVPRAQLERELQTAAKP